jgi:hypothetical protein
MLTTWFTTIYFIVIWYILGPFSIFPPFWYVCCTKKNQETQSQTDKKAKEPAGSWEKNENKRPELSGRNFFFSSKFYEIFLALKGDAEELKNVIKILSRSKDDKNRISSNFFVSSTILHKKSYEENHTSKVFSNVSIFLKYRKRSCRPVGNYVCM